MGERNIAQVVPATPGFWAHLIDDETGKVLPVREAVIAWLIDCRALMGGWLGHADAITTCGVVRQNHFIEQPDGTVSDASGSYVSVADAIAAIEPLNPPTD